MKCSFFIAAKIWPVVFQCFVDPEGENVEQKMNHTNFIANVKWKIVVNKKLAIFQPYINNEDRDEKIIDKSEFKI